MTPVDPELVKTQQMFDELLRAMGAEPRSMDLEKRAQQAREQKLKDIGRDEKRELDRLQRELQDVNQRRVRGQS